MGLLLLLFVVVPFVELWLLLRIGGEIGALPTIAGVVLVGALGAYLARREGLRVVRGWQEAVAAGRVPEQGLLESLLVLVGAVLLITPGVLTDVVGLALLVPPTRRVIAGLVRRAVERRVASGRIQVVSFGGERVDRGEVIDVDPGPER